MRKNLKQFKQNYNIPKLTIIKRSDLLEIASFY